MKEELLARFSYAFHECNRVVIQLLVARLMAKRAREQRRRLREQATSGAALGYSWRPLSEDCSKPGFLPVMSVVGPRWNCHAVAAGLGPLQVERELVCMVDGLSDVADSWSIVVYDQQQRTVTWSGSSLEDGSLVKFELAPGSYSLSLRFYSRRDLLVVPNVAVDGVDLNCGRVISGEASRYRGVLESLRGRQGLFYRALHYYVFHYLKDPGRAQSEWLRRKFLPVGNPDTEFRYGSLSRGQRLSITSDGAEEGRVNVYITFYNWASFPEYWCQVTDANWLSPSFDMDVAYAVRRVRAKRIQTSDARPQASFELRVV